MLIVAEEKSLITISEKWISKWSEARLYEADPEPGRPKFFITAAFPYPNSPPHIGHGRTYTVADIYARYMRLRGYNVLFPLGFHYTGTPILTMAEAVANNDEELIDLFINVYGVPREDIEKLKTPLGMARYFHKEFKEALTMLGISIDWRREFVSIDPEFSSFIRWQFETLRKKGYIEQGTHPVGWCPAHNMPVGMHDTKGDVEPEITEFTLIFFETSFNNDKIVLPTATLRPETVFGVTNIWVNPETEYIVAELDSVKLVLSKRAFWKLSFQYKNLRDTGVKIKGIELIGLRALNPITGREVPVLPASFVDPDTGSGVVMSVPAHAPFDYVALNELIGNNEGKALLNKLGVKEEELVPIPLIKVEGYSDIPARDVVSRMGIKSQGEREKLEEATKQVYSVEYRSGVMRKDIVSQVVFSNSYVKRLIQGFLTEWIVNKQVSEARENIKKWLYGSRLAKPMYEIANKPVYCRCGNEIVVKILEDQWFINYGDPGWKSLARTLLSRMKIIPKELRKDFEYTVEWLRRRACARTRGLGTRLPWNPEWVIESLSDSTIYMAFYTIVHKIRKYKIPADKLTIEFWDYVMLGKGSPEKLARTIGIKKEILEELRSEFDYWYPLDSRHSGKDLVQNHLTFFIFNHAAIFPEEKWPKQIVVNGFVLYEGSKMSKSLRNIVPLKHAITKYGPDPVRLALISGAELGQDADFKDSVAKSFAELLVRLLDLANKLSGYSDDMETRNWNKNQLWLINRFHRRLKQIENAMENFRFREAATIIFYEIEEDIKWYLQREGYSSIEDALTDNSNGVLFKYLFSMLARIMSPLAPFTAQELWTRLGKQGFIEEHAWPTADEKYIDDYLELSNDYIVNLLEDIKSILRVTRKTPNTISIYTAPRELYSLLTEAIDHIEESKRLSEYMRTVAEKYGRQRMKLAKRVFELAVRLSSKTRKLITSVGALDERSIIEENIEFLKRLLGAKTIKVYEYGAPGIEKPVKKEEPLPFKPIIHID